MLLAIGAAYCNVVFTVVFTGADAEPARERGQEGEQVEHWSTVQEEGEGGVRRNIAITVL